MTEKEKFIEFWSPTLGKEEAEKSWETKVAECIKNAPMVMPDIQPYRSMIDGSMITSRSKHRTHLKDHGCIEIGNEVKHLPKYGPKKSEGVKQSLIDTCKKLGYL